MPTEGLDPTWVDHFINGLKMLGLVVAVGIIVGFATHWRS
jgi:hypothetical protein